MYVENPMRPTRQLRSQRQICKFEICKLATPLELQLPAFASSWVLSVWHWDPVPALWWKQRNSARRTCV